MDQGGYLVIILSVILFSVDTYLYLVNNIDAYQIISAKPDLNSSDVHSLYETGMLWGTKLFPNHPRIETMHVGLTSNGRVVVKYMATYSWSPHQVVESGWFYAPKEIIELQLDNIWFWSKEKDLTFKPSLSGIIDLREYNITSIVITNCHFYGGP